MDISKLPILNYHKIEPQPDIGITARHPDDFIRDMQAIVKKGYKTITFRDITRGIELQPEHILITFDDGYDSVFRYALPVMRDLKMTGVVYIPFNFIGNLNDWDVQFFGRKYRHLNIEQLLELEAEGFEIGSHGISHRAFTQFAKKELSEELRQSKLLLEDIVKKEVCSVCYPFGRFNRIVQETAQAAGYRFGVSSLFFGSIPDEYISLSLKRFNVYRFDSTQTVLNKLNSKYYSMLAARDWIFQLGARATTIYQKVTT